MSNDRERKILRTRQNNLVMKILTLPAGHPDLTHLDICLMLTRARIWLNWGTLDDIGRAREAVKHVIRLEGRIQ